MLSLIQDYNNWLWVMTCDVDIEACEREVTKLTIVIEEDAVNGMVKGWDEEVEGPGVKPCGHESWRWDSNDWEREWWMRRKKKRWKKGLKIQDSRNEKVISWAFCVWKVTRILPGGKVKDNDEKRLREQNKCEINWLETIKVNLKLSKYSFRAYNLESKSTQFVLILPSDDQSER